MASLFRFRFKIEVITAPGIIRVDPDPAEVEQGTTVEWKFNFKGNSSGQLIFLVYFSEESPFNWNKNSTVISTDSPYKEAIVSGDAEKTGRFKYGIRVVDRENSKTLAEDDPWLIVKPR